MATALASPPRRRRRPKITRQPRVLTLAETRIRTWIEDNHGVLSAIARETGLSTSFVQRIAYNREAKSRDWVIERALKKEGCPLIQEVP